jgi:hypothetical protein
MGEDTRRINTERILLIVISILFLIALIYIAITTLGGKQGPAAAAPTPANTAPATPEEAASEAVQDPQPTVPTRAAVAADASPTPRRLDRPPTPTVFEVTEDDPRTILDLSNPDRVDYFDDEQTWYLYDSDNAMYWMEEGLLYGKDYQPEEKYVYWTFTNPQSGRVYAEVTATNGDCILKDSVGMVIRVQQDKSPTGYALEFACDGSYRLRLHRGPTKSPQELIEWTSSDAINTGSFASNRLGLWGYNGKFYLFANGRMIDEYYDADYPYTYGYFALYVRASDTFDLTATFDDFAFWHIPFIP